MIRHKTLWLLAGACMGVALLIGAYRFLREERVHSDHDQKAQVIAQAQALLSEDPSADRTETQGALRHAAVLVEEGDFQNAEGFYLLAQQYMREVDYNRAEAMFRRAIDANGNWSKPHAALGRLLMRNAVGRRDEAAKELKAAIEIEPDSWDAYDSLAILHRVEGELHAAHEAALKAVELAPGLVGPHNNLANLLVSLKKYDEAEQQYRAAIVLDPAHAKPYYNLACLDAIRGEKEEALKNLEAAITRSPSLRLQAVQDEDLRPLRKLAGFKTLVAQPKSAEGEGASGG